MTFKLEITAETWDELETKMGRRAATSLDELSLQEVLLYADKRATAEGYEIEVSKPGAGKAGGSLADQRREEARAKLRGELEGSLKEGDKGTTEPEQEPGPETEAKPKKAKKNGAGAHVDVDELKAKTIILLQDLFGSHKKDVMKILADHGGGLKNFAAIPAAKFPEIAAAVQEIVTPT
jgi:hypothetical protein